jgi:hypothetical protein
MSALSGDVAAFGLRGVAGMATKLLKRLRTIQSKNLAQN